MELYNYTTSEIQKGDFLDDNQIMNITDHFYIFKKGRISKNKAKNCKYTRLFCKLIQIDYTNRQAVLNFVGSYKHILGVNYIDSQSAVKTLAVTDNLVFDGKEYYFNYLSSKPLDDGIYNVQLIPKEVNIRNTSEVTGTITYNVFKVISKLVDNIGQLARDNTTIYGKSHSGCLTVDYYQSGYSGFQITGYKFDAKKFFIDYYINKEKGGVNIIMSDEQLKVIINNIKSKLEKIISDCIDHKKYKVSYDESYGEFSFNYIYLDDEISDKMFKTVNDVLKSIQHSISFPFQPDI